VGVGSEAEGVGAGVVGAGVVGAGVGVGVGAWVVGAGVVGADEGCAPEEPPEPGAGDGDPNGFGP